MDSSIYNGFHDAEGVGINIYTSCWHAQPFFQGFFSIYRNLFSRLAHDESLWGEHPLEDYPQFGDSSWPWAPASKHDAPTAARTFYAFWTNFVTAKDFSWFDQWELIEAPDRRVRR